MLGWRWIVRAWLDSEVRKHNVNIDTMSNLILTMLNQTSVVFL